MTYEQTMDYLYEQLPMFSRIGADAYRPSLDNTIALCKSLNDPQLNFPSVHIAGTNGKGSTSHMLAAVLQQAGYKTGLYTSPHLKDFRERIKVNGEMISKGFIVDFVKQTKVISDELKPSFFELTVAMAFEYFALQKVDIAVIETGLGGRLDSTNVLLPLVSVITNIGYDHVQLLGDTLPKIAAEKAGIIKQNIPVVIGEANDETRPVFTEKAKEMNAPIFFAEEQYKITDQQYKEAHLHATIEKNNKAVTYITDLAGLYQSKNIRTVLTTIDVLNEQFHPIPTNIVKAALQNTKPLTGLHGRWEKISTNPEVVLDVAHNEDGMRQVLNQIEAGYHLPTKKVHFVLGMVKDKDVTKVLSLLPADAHYYFTNANIPRAMEAKELKEKANGFGLKGNTYKDVNIAITAAKKKAADTDLIIVCGSVFLVGEVNETIEAAT